MGTDDTTTVQQHTQTNSRSDLGGAGTRLFFGGVQDVTRKGDQQTSAFFNDVWHFDEATGTFSTLWSPNLPKAVRL